MPLHADDNYEDDGEEATLGPVEAEETLAYQIGDKEEAEPVGKTISCPVCDNQQYNMHTVCR